MHSAGRNEVVVGGGWGVQYRYIDLLVISHNLQLDFTAVRECSNLKL